MRITAIVHAYPPIHNAGAEWMLHEMLKSLNIKGHKTDVIIPGAKAYDFEGVFINREKNLKNTDIVLTHLDKTGFTINLCDDNKKPLVFISHNTHNYSILRYKSYVSVIHNANHTRDTLKYPNKSIVVHPPVDQSRYKTKAGKNITLINLYELKGGNIFHDIAKLMPDIPFMGVEGMYGGQIKRKLSNVSYMKNTSEAKKDICKDKDIINAFTSGELWKNSSRSNVLWHPCDSNTNTRIKRSLRRCWYFL